MRTGREEGRWEREGGTPLSGGGADRGVGGKPGEGGFFQGGILKAK